MSLIIWFAVCLVAAVVLSRHPFLLCLGSLLLWCFVPQVATFRFNGYASKFAEVHPASLLILAAVTVQLFRGSPELKAAVAHRTGWLPTSVVIVLAAAIMGVLGRGLTVINAMVNQLIAPMSLFFLLGGCLLLRPERTYQLRRVLLSVAAAEALFAVLQAALGRPVLWSVFYARQYWFNDGFKRWMGTFDHPLILSLVLACAIFLLADVRRWWLSLILLFIFVGGLLTTQSRTGFVAGALGALYLLFRGRSSSVGKFLLLALGITVGTAAYRLGVGAPLADRVADDNGSSGARQQAFDYILQHWGDFFWWGRGLGTSFDVASDVGLQTSFESAALMYSIDLGVVVAALYFTLMVAVIVTKRSGAALGTTAAAAAAVVMVQTFSALSGASNVPAILWALLALAGFSSNKSLLLVPAESVLTQGPPLHEGSMVPRGRPRHV